MEKAKKPLLLGLLAVLLAAGILAAALWPRDTLDLKDLSQHLLAQPVYARGMAELDVQEVQERFGISPKQFDQCAAWAALDGTAREFLLLRAAGRQDAEKIAAALNLRCHGLLDQLEDQDEAGRVRAYQLRRTRNYVLFTVSDATASGSQAISDYLFRTRYDTRE